MISPLSAWLTFSVVHSVASCTDNTQELLNIRLVHYGSGTAQSPRFQKAPSDVYAASPKASLNCHFVESTDFIFSVHFSVHIGGE